MVQNLLGTVRYNQSARESLCQKNHLASFHLDVIQRLSSVKKSDAEKAKQRGTAYMRGHWSATLQVPLGLILVHSLRVIRI